MASGSIPADFIYQLNVIAMQLVQEEDLVDLLLLYHVTSGVPLVDLLVWYHVKPDVNLLLKFSFSIFTRKPKSPTATAH